MSSTDENRPRRRRRLLFIFAAVLLIAIGATAWILKTNEIVSNLGAVFTILGVLLAFLPEDRASPSSASASPADPMTTTQSHENGYTEIEDITPVTLGLTKGRGALIVYTTSSCFGSSINLIIGFNKSGALVDIVEHVTKRETKNSRAVYVGIFQDLLPTNYTVCSDTLDLKENVTIHAGKVKKIDLRQRSRRHATHQ